MEKHTAVAHKYKKRLRELPNVNGVGVGFKHVSGRPTDGLSVVVFVRRKVDLQALSAGETIPEELEGLKTDVVEVGDLQFLMSNRRTARWRPAPGGVSVGHYLITAGTLGTVVFDRVTGEPLILSNNHVLANATNGVDGRSAIGDVILQPGAYDGGKLDADVIARLKRFVPVHSEGASATAASAATAGVQERLNGFLKAVGSPFIVKAMEFQAQQMANANYMDAAIAEPVDPDAVVPEILNLGRVNGVSEAELGMRLLKSGRSSGTTSGSVKAVHAEVTVGMGDGRDAVFTDQVVCTPFSKPGDSGSLVLNEEGAAVGLLFAGSDRATIFSPIGAVLDQLGVTFDPPGGGVG